jgi:glycosyltransferase A (GT-A) superfamily protein (DUF2064 family)
MSNLVIVAKPCIPGRVKTRMHPEVSYEASAELAKISLDATVAMARRVQVDNRILFYDGPELPQEYSDFTLLQQPDNGDLDMRLGYMFDELEGRTLLIGMDTPQIDPAVLQTVFEGAGDAWFGFAQDGGFWALGLDEPDGALLRGVPMSQDYTGKVMLQRLEGANLAVEFLPMLEDFDSLATAISVANRIPASPFARALNSLVNA